MAPLVVNEYYKIGSTLYSVYKLKKKTMSVFLSLVAIT